MLKLFLNPVGAHEVLVLDDAQGGDARSRNSRSLYNTWEQQAWKNLRGMGGAKHSTNQFCSSIHESCCRAFVNFSSFFFHSSIFFASVIQLLLFVRSYLAFSFVHHQALRIRWCRPPIVFRVFLPFFGFWSCRQGRDASRRFFWSTFLVVRKRFFLPFATSVFCVFQSNTVSSVLSCVLQLLWCFSWCVQSNLLLFRWSQLLRRISSWKDTSLSWSLLLSWSEPSSVSLSVAYLLSSSACLSIPPFMFAASFFKLYFLFVCPIRRSIFRCVVLIFFSCFCDSVHVPPA